MELALYLVLCSLASCWIIYAIGKTWDGTWSWLADFLLGR